MRALRRSPHPHPHPRIPAEPWVRDVRLLAVSRGISMAGAEAGYIALLALAWQLTGSASQASIVLLASVIARTLGAPFAGWIGDHLDRRRVIIASEVVIAGAMCLMALATSIPQLFAALLVVTLAATACGAALDASLASLVPARALERANSTMGMARTTGHMVGPVLGGLAVAGFGARAAFLLDAASSLLAAALIIGVRGCVGGSSARARAGAVADASATTDRSLLAGLRVIARDPVLRLLVASGCGLCVCFAFVTAAELPLAVEFGAGEAGLGAIVSSWCVGSLVGAWMARRVNAAQQGPGTLALSAAASALVFIGTGLAPAFWCVLVLMAVGGFWMALSQVVETTILQQRIEDHVRARTMAAFGGLFSCVWGVNLAAAGLFVDAFSPQAAYVYGGVWCLVAAVGFLGLARLVRRERLRVELRLLVPRHALESELAEGA